jgi:hypothetical protein
MRFEVINATLLRYISTYVRVLFNEKKSREKEANQLRIELELRVDPYLSKGLDGD